jgi:hypothetical protein
MAKESRHWKSKQSTSRNEPMIEGADFGDSALAVATDESVVMMDERIGLNTSQAEGLNSLYAARREVETRIAFAEQMLGIQGREIVSGELGGENPYLMLKSLTNGVSD